MCASKTRSGDRGEVGRDHVLVLTARHRLAVVRQLVLDVVHEVVETPFVEDVEVGAVAAREIGGGHAGIVHGRSGSCRMTAEPRRVLGGERLESEEAAVLDEIRDDGERAQETDGQPEQRTSPVSAQ